MKKQHIIILLLAIAIIGIIIFFIFFNDKTAKNLKIGNNTSSQEIVDYILNISSYEATIKVEVKSNKNENQYIIKQKYEDSNNISQEILEPSNMAGVKISKNGNQLKIENSNLNLSSIFENYEYIGDNSLDLNSFIENYKADEKANWKEENNTIVMTTKNDKKEKILRIDRSTGKPTKLEVKENNKNSTVYILYNEVSTMVSNK